MEVHLKYLLHIGETLKNFILKKFLPLKKKIYKKKKKFTYFKYKISPDKILPKKKIGLKNLKNTGFQVKKMH